MRASGRPSAGRLPPLAKRGEEEVVDGHGRRETRTIEVLPAEAPDERIREEWPAVRSIARIRRWRIPLREGRPVAVEGTDVLVITGLEDPVPEFLLSLNRAHWLIEIMHRDRDVFLGEDGYINRRGRAPRNVFSPVGAARTILKMISPSITRAIELVQRDPGVALRLF